MLHFNLGLILKPHVAFERRVNFETPPLSKKGEKAFIILMKCCFQRNIDVLPSIAWLRKLCNAPFCKSKMQHEKYNTSALEQPNFWRIFKKHLIINCNLHSSTMEMQNIKFHKPWNMLSNLDQEVCWNFKARDEKEK